VVASSKPRSRLWLMFLSCDTEYPLRTRKAFRASSIDRPERKYAGIGHFRRHGQLEGVLGSRQKLPRLVSEYDRRQMRGHGVVVVAH